MQPSQLATLIQERREAFEDAGIRTSHTGDFLAALGDKLDLDLAYRTHSTPAAEALLYSLHNQESDALQQVRFDELLTAIQQDLNSAKAMCVGVYQDEEPYAQAGEFDEEDLARHEVLADRIKKLSRNMEEVAEHLESPGEAFNQAKETLAELQKLRTETRQNQTAQGAAIS